MSLHPTASQTVGPFLRIGLAPMTITEIAAPYVPGERITLRGRVFDGDGAPVYDALIEVWQANAEGRYTHPDDTQEKPLTPQFLGFGRSPTDDAGAFHFTTIKPGPVPGPDGQPQAPHLVVVVFMRGLLRHLVTRLYFPDEPANTSDPALTLVPAGRRATLIARPSPDGALEWDIHLQGADETVFFST
ncbi:MAG TPA: protocatechuate 3,4-dioxygenase subunit alpha [Ktedonobacterales bacterium]|nr:protocatechuate 3,4-dioxygenase subunit alpha [Ktedonobacterales bacterium]